MVHIAVVLKINSQFVLMIVLMIVRFDFFDSYLELMVLQKLERYIKNIEDFLMKHIQVQMHFQFNVRKKINRLTGKIYIYLFSSNRS